jgi:hypothetical protein
MAQTKLGQRHISHSSIKTVTELKNNWEEDTQKSTFEEGMSIGWWKMAIGRQWDEGKC